jgi:hypothetical protein
LQVLGCQFILFVTLAASGNFGVVERHVEEPLDDGSLEFRLSICG